MSASLVGSEMCIRDSPRSAPPARQRRVFWGAVASPGEGRGGSRGAAATTCLLYTSDAADDM
eukprot:8032983-Alexandrium_andersonii.AAC.1